MTRDERADEESPEALKRELADARATIRELEAELTETNEGMIALTLELEEAKERYQKTFEASNDAILLIDPDEDAIYEANPRACELFGYSHESLISLSASDIFPEEYSRDDSFVNAVVHGWVDGFACRTKDGKKLELEISASVFKLDDRALLLAAIRDVTQRKRREQQLQVLNRLFRHNLRNDGNVIQGHAEILHDELSDSELQRNATVIRDSITEILGLSRKVRRVQDVLDRDYVSSVELSELFEKQTAQFKQIHPRATLVTETPSRDVTVGQRLSPALHEAIENGIKHCDDAAPTVTVTAEIDAGGEQLLLIVTDQGPGLPEQELAVIREGEESPLEHGSGVGLWFIQWVVSSMGGELAIEDSDPDGTQLVMSVPIQEGDEREHYDPRGKSSTVGLTNVE